MDVDVVREVLDRDLTGFVVELTESRYVPTAELRRTADWLRKRGARLAIDDLGTGYAGLERLVSVRPDLIKLDRSLVAQLESDEVSRIMVESLVRFAARVGAGVIAEGIEKQSTLEVVAELDIAYGQGFLFAPARPTWSFPDLQAVEAARTVHQQALSATPRQDLLLNELVLLDRVAERFGEAEEVVDVQHAVVELTRLLSAVDVGIDLVAEADGQLVTLNHQSWADVGPVRELAHHPLLQWVVESRRAAQVLRGEPFSDDQQQERLVELGYGGLLLVPVVTRGAAIGLLSLFRDEPRPWSLAEIRLARIGAGQLAAALDRLSD
jgi:GAF domain-containing protein